MFYGLWESDSEAEAWFIECLTHSDHIGFEECVAYAYEGLAALAVRQGDAVRAARLLGAADILRAKIGTQHDLVEQAIYDDVVTRVRHLLSPETLASEWAVGRAASREEALRYAASGRKPPDSFARGRTRRGAPP